MNRILVVCPTIREEKVKIMLESIYATAEDIDVLCLTEVGSITQIMNRAFNENPDYEFYHITNDDFIYQTQGWDKVFMAKIQDKPGICYGNDLYMGANLPVAPFISGDIIRALGWLQMETLEHLCGDMVWKLIGDCLGRLYYFKDIIIEHVHPFASTSNETDEVYLKTNSPQMFLKDNDSFKDWVHHQSQKDIEKIRLALGL